MQLSITSLSAYFSTFAKANELSFCYGTAQRLREASRSDESFNYPILHLNRPIIKPISSRMANYMAEFHAEICILDLFSRTSDVEENLASELSAEDRSLTAMNLLLKQLNHDNKDGIIVFEFSGAEIEPVSNTFIDYHTGWKLTFQIQVFANANLC